ncbi:MAG: helix-turn-helix domain-containing protein [Ardenticatenia bacterium]|nr:helix-turn-helix domain-containing protein [Ardenticatenia bacterium]
MAWPKKDVVTLTEEQRTFLQSLLRKGRASARVLTRARILLLAAEGRRNGFIAEALQVSPATVINMSKRFVQEGLERALYDRPRPGGQPKLDAKGEATLIALACSDPPEGREHWTMQLLADKLVELGVVESISDETVRRVLKKPT